ncbi:MAG: thiamine pyrophosphate-dependent dehydrogenase E1 component subunit alpha [Candidatus Riflebacteria bacterium]|nr:thiamine pyrophosphate-dependent dehydrogenase E1 component subunit alpha [Candidatus Riflebacteria bacterium]
MLRIRRVEEETARIYPSDKIKSPVHLSIGQEPVAVGVCEALAAQDVLFGTYRSHATYLAKGGDLKSMMAELYGKATGCARGKGGSMHLVDVPHGAMGTSAVVATAIPHAVGYAYAMKVKKQDVVTVSFFGDGATEEGAFHESLNFASLKQVPALFICENNGYAVYSPFRVRQAHNNIWERPRGFGIESVRVEGNDVLAIYEQAREFVSRIRSTGTGPYFMECMTYRWRQHVGPLEDLDAPYRTPGEYKPWVEGDQIPRLEKMLPADTVARIRQGIESELREAIQFAEESPFPDDAELWTQLFKEA